MCVYKINIYVKYIPKVVSKSQLPKHLYSVTVRDCDGQ